MGVKDAIHLGQQSCDEGRKFFPRPLPLETVYSICARYHALSDDQDPRVTSSTLLGHARGGYHHEMPYGLGRLEVVSGGILAATQQLMRERTVLAAVLPYMTAQWRHQLLAMLVSSHVPASSRSKVGLSWAGSDATHDLRLCPDCVKEDHDARGFTYWRMPHQLLGVWICPKHGRPLQWLPNQLRMKHAWRQAERDSAELNEAAVDARTLIALDRVAKCVLWSASMPTLSMTTLSIMVRARLRQAQLVHTEMKVTDRELGTIHQILAAPLARTDISHFQRFTDCSWIHKTLIDPQYAHPLRWAVLLASTFTEKELPIGFQHGQGFELGDDQISIMLSQDYRLAEQRVPQPWLFNNLYSPRISRAPLELYKALGTAVNLQQSAVMSGLSMNEVKIWVRRDPNLVAHWRSAIRSIRIQEAENVIHAYLTDHPQARRIDVIRSQLPAVRSLERYDPALLEQLLPLVMSKYSGQRDLPLYSEA